MASIKLPHSITLLRDELRTVVRLIADIMRLQEITPLCDTLIDLAPRIEALAQKRYLGRLPSEVVRTVLVLGLLQAEALHPRDHVGAPKHVLGPTAAFVSFAMPHESAARRETLRQLLLFLLDWFDDGAGLRAAVKAALDCLPPVSPATRADQTPS